jgi:hypothetical protein
VHGLWETRRSGCGFPVTLLCAKGGRLWKDRGSPVENHASACGKAVRSRGKLALDCGKRCAIAAEKHHSSVDELWMICANV